MSLINNFSIRVKNVYVCVYSLIYFIIKFYNIGVDIIKYIKNHEL